MRWVVRALYPGGLDRRAAKRCTLFTEQVNAREREMLY